MKKSKVISNYIVCSNKKFNKYLSKISNKTNLPLLIFYKISQSSFTMSKRMTESQIVAILKEADAGMAIKDICRKYSVANSTVYKWREKYGGMEASDVKRLKELEEENRRLKQMYADLSLKSQLQEEIIKKL